MKKILSLLITTFIVLSFLLPIFSFESCAMEEQEPQELQEEVSARELSLIHMNKEMLEIEHLKEMDRLEWYKKYRNIICKYRNVLDPPLSVFDFYTEDEVRLICRTVETECHGQNFESKVMVANVIYNRLESKDYSSNVEEVIKSPYQFVYWRTVIPEDTLYAATYGFEMGDLTDGSLAFHSNEKTERFAGMDYVFTDEMSGLHFYK